MRAEMVNGEVDGSGSGNVDGGLEDLLHSHRLCAQDAPNAERAKRLYVDADRADHIYRAEPTYVSRGCDPVF